MTPNQMIEEIGNLNKHDFSELLFQISDFLRMQSDHATTSQRSGNPREVFLNCGELIESAAIKFLEYKNAKEVEP
jgi:hypothetical protein